MVVVFYLSMLVGYCLVIWRGLSFLFLSPKRIEFGRRKVIESQTSFPRFPKKPAWVSKEIIRMKALMPQTDCRKLADSFNRRFAKEKLITVGKTYVNRIIQQHQYEIQVLRKSIKHRKPSRFRKILYGALT